MDIFCNIMKLHISKTQEEFFIELFSRRYATFYIKYGKVAPAWFLFTL